MNKCLPLKIIVSGIITIIFSVCVVRFLPFILMSLFDVDRPLFFVLGIAVLAFIILVTTCLLKFAFKKTIRALVILYQSIFLLVSIIGFMYSLSIKHWHFHPFTDIKEYLYSFDDHDYAHYGITDRWGFSIIKMAHTNIVVCNNENNKLFACIDKEDDNQIITIKNAKAETVGRYSFRRAENGITLYDYLSIKVGFPIEQVGWNPINYLKKVIIIPADDEESRIDKKGSNYQDQGNNCDQPNDQPPHYEPQPHKTSVPVQVWIECPNCLNSGQCPYCHGQGHYDYGYGTQDCAVCTDGRCVMCAGQGGHYETRYETRIDYY